MPIVLQKALFLHVPKTGGTWARSVLRAACPQSLELIRFGAHANLQTLPPQHHRPIVFCFFRCPEDWYQSYWKFRAIHHNWAWEPCVLQEFDQACKSGTFEGFLENVCMLRPGYISTLYERFTQGLTHAGRFENLVEDLITILDYAGEEYDRDVILNHPPKQPGLFPEGTGSLNDQAAYPPGWREKIKDMEQRGYQVIDKYTGLVKDS